MISNSPRTYAVNVLHGSPQRDADTNENDDVNEMEHHVLDVAYRVTRGEYYRCRISAARRAWMLMHAKILRGGA